MHYLEVAKEAAQTAGGLLRAHFEKPLTVNATTAHDIKLEVDVLAQDLITKILLERFPEHALYGEEGIVGDQSSDHQWVVDPLDGTVNFLYGLRTWAVSIALEDPDGLAVGVVLNPVDEECFTAVRGEGATMNGRRIHVTGCPTLDRAMVATGFSYEAEQRARQAELLTRLLPRVRDIRRAGAAALDLAYVACGRVDAFYERGLKRWDEAAGRLLVEEAGGVVTDLKGEPAGVLAAATPQLAALLEQEVD
jgi:myo-inositol-1(or 4)-monophosphatase